jgi:6-methylsalicylate decarboxylase
MENPMTCVELQLALMKELNISKSILSINSPGTSLVEGDEAAIHRLTSQCTDYVANIVSQQPASLGFWAALFFDVINADGITLDPNRHVLFIDDASILAVGSTAQSNCKILGHPSESREVGTTT